MSRKLDWADVEARQLARAIGVASDKTALALIAATLRLAHSRGVGDSLDKADEIINRRPESGSTS